MTPQDKAKELVEKFGGKHVEFEKLSIQCALICVDEILSSVPMYTGGLNPMYRFYQEVKQELLNLK